MTADTTLEATRHDAAIVPTGSSWTPDRVALVKATVAQDTSDDELAMFLSVAQSRDLDPFSGEIHAIVRGKGEKRKMTIQTGIGGYRKIADRTGLVEWVGEQEFTADGVTWTTAWLEDGPPAAARFTLKRKDRTKPETRTVKWDEYVQRTSSGDVMHMWADKPCTMLGKVAEATALRAAFPNDLNGLYVDEEMGQADVVEVVQRAAHPQLDDHLDGFDPEFLTTIDLDAAREYAANGRDHLTATLRNLTRRQEAWRNAPDTETPPVEDADVVDAEVVEDQGEDRAETMPDHIPADHETSDEVAEHEEPDVELPADDRKAAAQRFHEFAQLFRGYPPAFRDWLHREGKLLTAKQLAVRSDEDLVRAEARLAELHDWWIQTIDSTPGDDGDQGDGRW